MQILVLISIGHHKSNRCLLCAAKPLEVIILFLFMIHDVEHPHYTEGKHSAWIQWWDKDTARWK